MHVGCFALVDPFETLDHQLERIAEMGFEHADVTDNHPGGLLGREFDFAATVSLDDNPADVRAAAAGCLRTDQHGDSPGRPRRGHLRALGCQSGRRP